MAFLAAAAGPLGIIGAGLSAFGTIEQGIATANAASYSAEVARNNALIAEQNAQHAIEAGQAKATATSLKGAAIAGKVRASQAASGVDVNSGSAVDVQASQDEVSKLDTETTLSNAELAAYGYRSQATSYLAQAQLDEQMAEQAPIGALFGAGGSLLSKVSALGFKWSGVPDEAAA